MVKPSHWKPCLNGGDLVSGNMCFTCRFPRTWRSWANRMLLLLLGNSGVTESTALCTLFASNESKLTHSTKFQSLGLDTGWTGPDISESQPLARKHPKESFIPLCNIMFCDAEVSSRKAVNQHKGGCRLPTLRLDWLPGSLSKRGNTLRGWQDYWGGQRKKVTFPIKSMCAFQWDKSIYKNSFLLISEHLRTDSPQKWKVLSEPSLCLSLCYFFVLPLFTWNVAQVFWDV